MSCPRRPPPPTPLYRSRGRPRPPLEASSAPARATRGVARANDRRARAVKGVREGARGREGGPTTRGHPFLPKKKQRSRQLHFFRRFSPVPSSRATHARAPQQLLQQHAPDKSRHARQEDHGAIKLAADREVVLAHFVAFCRTEGREGQLGVPGRKESRAPPKAPVGLSRGQSLWAIGLGVREARALGMVRVCVKKGGARTGGFWFVCVWRGRRWVAVGGAAL
jgi:hypothetical protein